METFIILWPLWIYLIGMSVNYAIIEDKRKQVEPVDLLVCAMWPFTICVMVLTCILYPTYYLTKKLINFLKHIK